MCREPSQRLESMHEKPTLRENALHPFSLDGQFKPGEGLFGRASREVSISPMDSRPAKFNRLRYFGDWGYGWHLPSQKGCILSVGTMTGTTIRERKLGPLEDPIPARRDRPPPDFTHPPIINESEIGRANILHNHTTKGTISTCFPWSHLSRLGILGSL